MKLKSYLLPALMALLLHGAVFFVLADVWFEPEKTVVKVPRHVNAQIVDRKSITTSADRKRQADAQKRKADDAKRKKIAQEKRRKAAAEKKRKQEIAREKAAAEKKRKQEVARKKAEAEKKRKQEVARKKAEAEKKRKQEVARKQAEAKRQQELAAKQAAEKKAAEEKARQEAAEAESVRQEQERLAAEKQRREEAAQKARDAALAAALAEEEAQLAEEEGHQAALSYEAYVRDQISRYWRRSPNARNGMVVELSIHLLPSGEVDDAYVSKSSGDDRFDRDAVRAVLKAASFPELQSLDPVVFDRYYRKFTMIFRPEDLRY